MKTFDRTNLKFLREELNKVLQNAGIDGVEFEIGNMRYSDTEATIKITAKTSGAENKNIERVKLRAKMFGIASLEAGGWNLIRFDDKKRKYPFIATNEKGVTYKLSIEQAQTRFGKVA